MRSEKRKFHPEISPSQSPPPPPREVLEGGGGGGAGTQKFVHQKWPDQIFPIVNFVGPLYSPFGLEGGLGGSSYGAPPFQYPPPPRVQQ